MFIVLAYYRNDPTEPKIYFAKEWEHALGDDIDINGTVKDLLDCINTALNNDGDTVKVYRDDEYLCKIER